MIESDKTQQTPTKNWLLVGLFGLLSFLALGERWYFLDSGGTLGEVQFRSAVIARHFYFQRADNIPAWRLEANDNSIARLNIKEPSITEYLVSLGYSVAGREGLDIARLFTVALWLIGGVFLWLLARHISSGAAALVALAYYLFVPLGVRLSVSFLSDPLMIMGFVIGLWAIVRYEEQSTNGRLLLAGVASGLTVLVKPLAGFPLVVGFLALHLVRHKHWRALFDARLLLFLFLTVLPPAIYYLPRLFITDELSGQAQSLLRTELWFQPRAWRGWLFTIVDAVGLMPLIAALLGLTFAQSTKMRALLVGLWLGYGIMGMVFIYHMQITLHYQSPLLVIIALSIMPLVDTLLTALRTRQTSWLWIAPALAALLVIAIFTWRDTRNSLLWRPSESIAAAREIGEIVQHSDRVVYLAHYYGRPLEYWGEITGTFWPRSELPWPVATADNSNLDIQTRLDGLGFNPKYFVITDFDEYSHHPDMQDHLDDCEVVAKNDRYLIYEFCLSDAAQQK